MRREFLCANLCFLHGTMTASEGLLEAAIDKCESYELREYFAQHLLEERGHLQMLEHDLERLGVKRILRFPAAAQLAGAQYYYIEHEHPAMLLGYMAALEGRAPTLEQVQRVESEHGPLACSRHHALHDPGHVAAIRAQIALLRPELRGRVEENEAWTLSELGSRVIPMIERAANHFKVST